MGIEDNRTNIMHKLGVDNLFDLSQTNCCGGVRMPDLDRDEKESHSAIVCLEKLLAGCRLGLFVQGISLIIRHMHKTT